MSANPACYRRILRISYAYATQRGKESNGDRAAREHLLPLPLAHASLLTTIGCFGSTAVSYHETPLCLRHQGRCSTGRLRLHPESGAQRRGHFRTLFLAMNRTIREIPLRSLVIGSDRMQIIDEVSQDYDGTLSREFIEFARRQLVNASTYRGSEKRGEGRQPMMLHAMVVPIDENNQAIGRPIEVVTRDVASTSIGLFHEQPLEHKRHALKMRMAGVDICVVVSRIWMGEMGPFYGSAGWFVEQLSELPVEIADAEWPGATPCYEHQAEI